MLAVVLAGGAMTSQAAVSLRLDMADGTSRTFLLSEKPVINFPGEEMTVATSDASFSCLRADVENMVFVDDTSAVNKIEAGDGELFSFINGVVDCPGADITIYDLGGAVCSSGRDSLSIDNLKAGIYIVKTNQHCVKIIKK